MTDSEERAAEVEALILRQMDPDDPYNGSDEDGRTMKVEVK
jgi:hypothetical protein